MALFAALAYALLESSRSTGNNISHESDSIIAGQVTEMPAAVRQGVARMVIEGTAPIDITFTDTNSSNDVFYSGLAGNTPPPQGACNTGCTVWTYQSFTDMTHGLFVGGVGTDAPEIMAVLPDVTLDVCEQIQKGLSYPLTPPVQDSAAFDWTNITGTISQAGGLKGSATTIWAPTLTGVQFACVNNLNTGYFYYHVLLPQ
ncbi:MAG: hypothetical protein KGQ70_01970 [Alphaproteobacteria bacterium]|nr:hypothetical protein [Alphaproteobacteria bacterium]